LNELQPRIFVGGWKLGAQRQCLIDHEGWFEISLPRRQVRGANARRLKPV